MFKELVFVRHGQCTGNVADRASVKGDHSFYTSDFRQTSSDTWPLTDLGYSQSQAAGILIRDIISNSFDFFVTSDSIRAIQTSQGLGFSSVSWKTEILLRERNWGGNELVPIPERERIFENSGIARREDSIDWAPVNGETMISVKARLNQFILSIQSDLRGKKVLVVTHGGVMQAARLIHHNVASNEYIDFISGDNYIRNCQIIRYTTDLNTGIQTEEIYFLDQAFNWVKRKLTI